jgi:hypothetical protein
VAGAMHVAVVVACGRHVCGSNARCWHSVLSFKVQDMRHRCGPTLLVVPGVCSTGLSQELRTVSVGCSAEHQQPSTAVSLFVAVSLWVRALTVANQLQLTRWH